MKLFPEFSQAMLVVAQSHAQTSKKQARHTKRGTSSKQLTFSGAPATDTQADIDEAIPAYGDPALIRNLSV